MYNSHYEKILVTGEVRCIDDEIPFEIPDNWEWARMGYVGDWGSGSTPHRGNPSYYGGNILWLKTGELNNSIVYDTEEKITEKAWKECSLRLNKVGDVLIAMYGATIGKIAIVGNELTTNQACCGCSPILMYNYYLFYFLMASRTDFIKQGEGGAQPNISREKLVRYFIPIPPLAEQKRIVDKIEELLPLIDKYSCLQTNLEILDDGINNHLKKSILQYAIQGKLVPQIDAEEPATKLLEKIHAEKLQLLKEGKLKKKDIQESFIFKDDDNRYYEQIGKEIVCIDDELPFDIPQTWTWVRLGNICEILNGFAFKSNKYVSSGIRIIRITNVQDGYIEDKTPVYYPLQFSEELDKYLLTKGDLLMSLTGNVGRVGVLPASFLPAALNQRVACIRFYTPEIKEYIIWYLQSDIFRKRCTLSGKGMAQQNISTEWLKKEYIPLPPLEEQRRIVNVLNRVLKSIEGL